MEKTERNRTAILSVLQQATDPVNSGRLAERLTRQRRPFERADGPAVLNQLDTEGLTSPAEGEGGPSPAKGRDELRAIHVARNELAISRPRSTR